MTLERLGFHEITVDDPDHFAFIRGQESGGTRCREPPRSLTVPVVGLRLPLEGINLEPFPEDLRVKCHQLYDEEFYTSRVWIFGRASDAARTYYVLTGYFKRLDINPNRKLYEFWDDGAVYTVTGTKCGGDDAGETFEVRDPNADKDGNVPIPVLKALALDLAARTLKAFGGADRLRAEIKNQRIDFDRLSPEQQEAFKPYFGTANQIKPRSGFAQDFKSRAKYAWFATAFPETREAAGKALDPRTRRPAKYKRPQTC